MRITVCDVKEIKDSRGTPTIEVYLETDNRLRARASVPSGKSAGSREAVEKRDSDGVGVHEVMRGIERIIRPELLERPWWKHANEVDEMLIAVDGTKNKARLGANATLAISIAATRLFAKEARMPVWKLIAREHGFSPRIPRLYMNTINGGAHANFRLPFQEYIVVVGGEGVSAAEAFDRARDIFEHVGTYLAEDLGHVPLGDEGGYAPKHSDTGYPFEVLERFVKRDPMSFLAIDAAASEFYDGEMGLYKVGERMHVGGMLHEIYAHLTKRYKLRSIEDPFHESDTEGFANLTKELGDQIKIVGDDFTVTNAEILAGRIKRRAGNALIIKPNQIGTLMEVYDTVRAAQAAGWECIASHRSGETEDSFIADLAVGIGAYGLKAGAPTQDERMAKYARLLAIEEEMREGR